MAMPDKEGWYEDPAERHEYRWFSDGVPTDLVRDGRETSRDEISIRDPEVYRSMELGRPPDTGPLLHKDDDAPPHFEIVNLGVGPVWAVNTSAPYDADARGTDRARARIVVGATLVTGVLVTALIGAPGLAFLGVSALVALTGRLRRRRRRTR